MEKHRITLQPGGRTLQVCHGENLLAALRAAGLAVEAPCGGTGKCGKCTVMVDGAPVLACRTAVEKDIIVALPSVGAQVILAEGKQVPVEMEDPESGVLFAVDIGTTTVVGYLLDGKTGKELACRSQSNPQTSFGADVITRIRYAREGQASRLTACIRRCVAGIMEALCRDANVSPAQIRMVSIVGNPAMQQLFLGISTENLTQIPFAPVLTQGSEVPAKAYLPGCTNGKLLIVPDISGFVGADTVACVLATALHRQEKITLLVDIGTNGEMVLGNVKRMVACSTAAGPALEGASISCGMRGREGAIDHVYLEDGKLRCSVIGGGEAEGICGSGLIDAVAAALQAGWLNSRGKILHPAGCIPLTEKLFLTQEDIRQVQAAKGAIAAGIRLMAAHLGLGMEDIEKVYLAGAFGTYMDPASACRIGLLPPELKGKTEAAGNAAGSGAKLLCCNAQALQEAQALTERIEFLELAAVEDFRRCFAMSMRF